MVSVSSDLQKPPFVDLGFSCHPLKTIGGAYCNKWNLKVTTEYQLKKF